jgi:hypothetical protein
LEFNEPSKKIFNLKCLWLVLARFDYMGLVEGATKGDSNELGKG